MAKSPIVDTSLLFIYQKEVLESMYACIVHAQASQHYNALLPFALMSVFPKENHWELWIPEQQCVEEHWHQSAWGCSGPSLHKVFTFPGIIHMESTWNPTLFPMDSTKQIPNSMEILLWFQGSNSILLLLSKIYQHQELNTQLCDLWEDQCTRKGGERATRGLNRCMNHT